MNIYVDAYLQNIVYLQCYLALTQTCRFDVESLRVVV